MSKTGHASFDRWKDEFSATVRDIEAAMHERAISSSSSSSSGTPAITDNDDNKDNATELIRRASTILAKLSSEAGKVSEREEPALKQELLDIYKACRMQIKTYKSLNKQRELFDDPSGGATTTRTKQTPMTKPATKPSVSEQRSSLFGSSAGTTPRNNNNNNNNNGGRWGSDAGGVRERVASTTQGRVRNQNSRLEDALRSIRESEQVAMEITGELEGQRESLETTRGRLGQFASMTEYSKGLLNSMNKPWWRKW
mmetsp:Transcript_109718/g.224180  ORF Transcript_109718/g.224180 Transcript_109718/m.224180 type:complete len:255 (-) Transcript_109718:191-955(-)